MNNLPELEKNIQPTPSEFDGKKYLVYRGKQLGNMFFSAYSDTYEEGWYEIVAGTDTMWAAQRILGFPEKHRTDDREKT